jgi:hypothetical protein
LLHERTSIYLVTFHLVIAVAEVLFQNAVGFRGRKRKSGRFVAAGAESSRI